MCGVGQTTAAMAILNDINYVTTMQHKPKRKHLTKEALKTLIIVCIARPAGLCLSIYCTWLVSTDKLEERGVALFVVSASHLPSCKLPPQFTLDAFLGLLWRRGRLGKSKVFEFVPGHQVSESSVSPSFSATRVPCHVVSVGISGSYLSILHPRYDFARSRHSSSLTPRTFFMHAR